METESFIADKSLFEAVGNMTTECSSSGNSSSTIDYYIPSNLVLAIVATILGVVLLAGIAGNILVLITIAAVKSMHTTVNRCLFSLALADLNILVFVPIFPVNEDLAESQIDFGEGICKYCLLIDRGLPMCSVLTFMYVTIDRYMAICHPLRPRRFSTGKKVCVTLTLIWIVSMALSYPFLPTTRYQIHHTDNKTYFYCYWDFTNDSWIPMYDTIINGVLFYLVVPVLLGLYGGMVYRIKTSMPKRGDTTAVNVSAKARGRNQVVVMLFSALVIYLVTQLPVRILIILDTFLPDVFSFYPFDATAFGIVWMGRLLLYVNSAANPLLYFYLSTNFRRALAKLFFCRRRRKAAQKQRSATELSTLGEN